MKRLAILFAFLFVCISAFSQKVSDVRVSQEGNCISVSYYIDKATSKVQLMVSVDGGRTFSRPLKKVSGDIENVQPGRRTITWDVLSEWEKLDGNDIVFNVVAASSSVSDLSAPGTANCYIVSVPGTYKFKATVKGGSTLPLDGTPYSAEVLWESFGTDVTPSVGDIVNNVIYEDGYVTLSTPSVLNNGNAVIAVKSASGTILWSWHIWVCEGFDPKATAQRYNNNAGTMMDRNLGATSATPGDVHALGLLYQWGRKDPFLGGNSISSSTTAASTITWPGTVPSNSSSGTIVYAVAHPTTFITYNGSNDDWYYTGSSWTDNMRWNTSKGIYDPCPKGWRVPDGGDNETWSKSFRKGSDWRKSSNWNGANRGMDFGSTNRTLGTGTIWYPAAGFRSGDDGTLGNVGYDGTFWSCTPNGNNAYGLYFYDLGRVFPSSNFYRAYGRSVRCLSE